MQTQWMMDMPTIIKGNFTQELQMTANTLRDFPLTFRCKKIAHENLCQCRSLDMLAANTAPVIPVNVTTHCRYCSERRQKISWWHLGISVLFLNFREKTDYSNWNGYLEISSLKRKSNWITRFFSWSFFHSLIIYNTKYKFKTSWKKLKDVEQFSSQVAFPRCSFTWVF